MPISARSVFAALSILLLPALTTAAQTEATPCPEDATYTAFHDPQRVTIRGYDDDAMEPFLSRDGAVLFFNNRNVPSVNTNIQYARRIDDLTFEYLGEVAGVNTDALEGVPTMDREGRFYFVSTRSYNSTFSTVYVGQFADGMVSDVELVDGISRQEPGIVNFDAEISADGSRLYTVDGQFDAQGGPYEADFVIAARSEDGQGFERLPESADLFAHINTESLEYAAAVSEDELEFFFTRWTPDQPLPQGIGIYRASRPSLEAPFDCPQRISAIEGFTEAPTLSPDGRSLYYHRLENGRFVIYRVTR